MVPHFGVAPPITIDRSDEIQICFMISGSWLSLVIPIMLIMYFTILCILTITNVVPHCH